MQSYTDLFNEYLSVPETSAPVQQKQASVAVASDSKQQNLGNLPPAEELYRSVAAASTGRSDKLQSELSRDLATMNALELYAKYGAQAGQLLAGRTQEELNYRDDASATRSQGDTLRDFGVDVGLGVVNAVGGIGALGTGLVSDKGGAAVSEFVKDTNDFATTNLKSDGLQRRRRANNAIRAVDSEANAAQYEKERKTDGEFVASLNRIGRGVLDAVKSGTEDSAVFGSDLGQAVGSLLTAGPASKAITAAATPVVRGLGKAGIRTGAISPFNTVLPKIATRATGASTPAAIGLMEAGGAYQGTVSEIMEMDHESLLQNSPDYAQLISEGVDPEEAKLQIAGSAGRTAAAIQAPVGAVTGTLVSKFEANPLRGNGNIVSNMLREAVEEGIQSGSGESAKNYAIRENADQTRALSEGVGEGIGQGALHGSMAAGVVQAPAATARTTAKAVGATARTTMRGARAVGSAAASAAKVVGGPLYDRILERADRIIAENEKASPVSEENVSEAVGSASAAAPDLELNLRQAIDETTIEPERKQQAHSYLDDLLSSVRFDEAELENSDMPAPIRETLTGSTDRFDAIRRLTDLVNSSDEGSQDQLTAASYLYEMLSKNSDLTDRKLVDAIEEIPDDHPSLPLLRQFENAVIGIQQTPKVLKALAAADQIAKTANEKGELKPVDEAQLSTPAGKQTVRNTITVAEVSPLNANPEANDQILRHAEQGHINITPAQRTALHASSSLVRAQKARLEKIQQLGLSTNRDIVSEDVLIRDSGQETRTPSVAGHVKRIIAAARSGDNDVTAAYLTSLARFAQHMQNKVAALNEALATGKNSKTNFVRYQSLTPSGRFRLSPSTVGMYVNPYAPGSIKTAQVIAADAETVAKVANEILSAFPDLGVKPVEPVVLDTSLDGPADEVAKAYQEGRAQKNAAEAEALSESQAEPAPKQDDSQLDLPLDQKAEEESSTPESEAKDQPKGGDQSAETEVVQTQENEAEAKPETEQQQSPAPVEEDTSTSETAEVAPASVEDDRGATEAGRADEPSPETESEGPADTAVQSGPVEAEPKKTIAELFPKLPEWSWLKRIFRVPEEPRTRIIGTETPLSVVKQALSSAKSLQDFLGSELKHEFTDEMAREYGAYLEMGDRLKEVLSKRLAESKEKARFLKGEERVPRFRNGKVLNLTEEVDGDLIYNDELVEAATLAALQWLLVADRFQSILNQEDVADILGAPGSVISDSLVNKLNEGLSLVEAKRSLARMIKSYWGLTNQPNAPIGQVEGIPEAMAAELLHALVEAEGLRQQTVEVTDVDGLPDGEKRTLHVFTPIKFNAESPLLAFPDAIEHAVLTEPEPVNYIGEAPTRVAETQLRNPDVKLTDQQKEAIRFEQKQPHFANLPMVDLFTALGLDNVLKLFGAGDLDSRPLNAEDRKSKEGLNRTFGSAYLSLAKLMAELRNKASVAGVEPDQLPIHYDYTFTRVNRMQMLGLNNPQASKLIREAVLPTRSTIDLSNQGGQDFGRFTLALAQALDIKVHNMSREDASQKVLDRLSNELSGSVELLQDWLKDTSKPLTSEQVDTLVSELGQGTAPVALHAVTEYARYLNADEKSRKAFNTSLYVEADGVTNGPVNAMQLLTPGRFTVEWLRNIRKGGLFIGATGRTMNEHRQFDDADDLYTETTNTLSILMADFTRTLRSQPEVNGHMTALSQLMDMLLPDVTFDGEDLVFQRGMAKNPLTITIYGSGARGIANKVAGQLAEAVYEKLSSAMQAVNATKGLTFAEAMFPDATDPAQQLDDFYASINALTTKVVRKGRNGLFLDDGEKVPNRKLNPETFTLDRSEFRNLQQNMLTLFVEPLRAAIDDTVGDSLMGAANVLRQAVQIQSIFLQYAFQQKVEEKLEEKSKDPEWTKEDFLSQDELTEIFKELSSLAPIIETDAQRYYIAHSQSADVGASEFGSSLQDQMRTPAYVQGPTDAGVAGIPAMVIGSGDGMMMQILSTMENAPDRTLKIFDGMNMPLDAIEEGSQRANQAVFESWMGNPLQAVSKSYTAFLEALSIDEMSKPQMEALARALNLRSDRFKAADLEAGIQALGPKLELMALQVEARHKALARVGLSVDQMAAVGAPYVHEGEVSLEGLSDEQVVNELNRIAREEYEKLTKPKPAKTEEKTETVKEVSENIAPELESVGRLLKNGARVVSHTALKKLVKSLNVPAEHKALLGDILRTLTTKEYKIVYGTPEQVQAYADERGLNLYDEDYGEDVLLNGFLVPSDRTIYLHNPSSEILVHELIHAATFDKIQAYYNGDNLGSNALEQVRAIQRLEKLMEQFLDLSMHGESEATQRAYFDATDTIEGHLNKGEKAAALNEFMAWGLANSQLQALQKKTEASPLVQLARKVVEMVKRLVWGKRKMPPAGRDMFSNLRFNTGVLMQSKFDARKAFARTVLFHNQSYGNSDRLVQLNKTLNRKIIRHLRSSITEGSEAVRDRRVANQAAKMFASSDVLMDVVDQGFTMNAQERTTFQLLVSTLKTTVDLDPNALSRVQELYAHVTEKLTVEDFMANPESREPADHYWAEQKFNVIVGDSQVEFDEQGRSTLLPVFLALAIVNDQFRTILSKMDVPKSDRREGKSLDAIIDNLGHSALDTLQAKVSGEGTKAPNVQAAIDALTQRIMDTAEDRESFLQQMASPAGNAIDRGNEIVVNGMQRLAEATAKKADEVKASTDDKLVKFAASFARGIAGIVDERTGARVAEGAVAAANRVNLWKPLHELLNDLVGRTESNAPVYDMIKQVRNLIQQRRQQFREHLPTVIASKFSRKITEDEQTAMFRGMGKTDLAALRPHLTKQEVLDILEDSKELNNQIELLENQLKTMDPKHWQRIQQKAHQLAHFMNTGEAGTNLLRNAKAVSNLFGEGLKRKPASDQLISVVDQLTTLYALEGLPQETKDTLSSLVQSEAEGMQFVLDYLVGNRKDEMAKAVRNGADVNHYKGYMPVEYQGGMTLIVANDEDYAELAAKSFVRVGDYKGSSLDRGAPSRGYYFAPVSGRAVYNQGIMQNVRMTAYGVDLTTGFTHGMTAGRIENPAVVKRIYQRMNQERGNETLLPVYDSNGDIVAYERSIDPKMLERLNRQTDLSKLIGAWRGRQLEEMEAQNVNEVLIDRLYDMWQKDIKEDADKQREYVDLRNPKELKKDPVLADAVKLFSGDTHAYIDSVFGDHFYVRRDMLNDAVGYHQASVGDLWTKNSRLPKGALNQAQKLAIGIFGNNAYKYMVNSEKILQNLVNDARVMVVVKSVVVPMTNLISNVYQLWGRGVPVLEIAKGMPKKAAEVNSYLKSRLRLDEVEAELRAATDDPIRTRALNGEKQSILDSHRRMSIWPLIEAGEFSSISDGTLTHEDLTLTEGRLSEYIEKAVDRLPPHIREAGRYAVISRDTALFRALQKSVEYGDFLAKSVLYEHLTKRKKLSQKDALARITEEFVNYDRLPGRTRGYLESIGLLWFWNFKIRTTKVALSMIRNNPLHVLLAGVAPTPEMFGTVGLPAEDNLFSVAADGRLDYSMGPGMGFRAPELNPWFNLVN